MLHIKIDDDYTIRVAIARKTSGPCKPLAMISVYTACLNWNRNLRYYAFKHASKLSAMTLIAGGQTSEAGDHVGFTGQYKDQCATMLAEK